MASKIDLWDKYSVHQIKKSVTFNEIMNIVISPYLMTWNKDTWDSHGTILYTVTNRENITLEYTVWMYEILNIGPYFLVSVYFLLSYSSWQCLWPTVSYYSLGFMKEPESIKKICQDKLERMTSFSKTA